MSDCCCEDPRDPVAYCPAHRWRYVCVRAMGATLHKHPQKPNGRGTGVPLPPTRTNERTG